jgi:hypothetical protein
LIILPIYSLFRSVQGSLPPTVSPYAPIQVSTDGTSLHGAGSPILVLIDEHADNPFGVYWTEILRAEGLNCFQAAYLSAVDSVLLDQFDIVLLAEGALTGRQAEMLESYVARGGQLVAMRPAIRLASLLGVQPAAGSTVEGYLQVESDDPVSKGIATETMQFHGQADHYRLAGARAVAWLASDADERTGFPAVTLHRHGQGQAALWAFDLARSIAYTRQGNPAWANQERDGFWKIRPTDMLKDWVDLDRLAIPQADEQQRLLANLLSAMSQGARPLPRLWYFPKDAEGVLVATTDAHQNSGSAVSEVVAHVEQYGGHLSIYYLPPLYPAWRKMVQRPRWTAAELSLADEAYLPSPRHIAEWRRRGHEFTLHPEIKNGLEADWLEYWRGFTGVNYGPVSQTARTHAVVWTGWTETARVQASYGMRMNLDYYHVGTAFRKETGEWAFGHMTGSGLPIKFVDEQGRILNIYQQPTQLADDHLLNLHWGGDVKLSAEDAVKVSERLLDSSVDGYYSAVGAIFHTDPFDEDEKFAREEARWLDGTLAHAAEKGIPIWSAEEWLRFTDVRHDADFAEVRWHPDQKRMSFDLEARSAPEVTLTLMIPLLTRDARLTQVYVDEKAVSHLERTLGGVDYGWVTVPAGSHQIVAAYQ